MTPVEAKLIRKRCAGMACGLSGPHPLDGKSVAQWVAEARAGWPRVPVPKDPHKAALRVLSQHQDVEVKWT